MPKIIFDWGLEGVREAIKNEEIPIIVDILRFSSTITTAIAHGFIIYPFFNKKRAAEFASENGFELAGKTGEAKFSNSSLSFLENKDYKNKKVVLATPNGGACAELFQEEGLGYIGSFLNAGAVADYVNQLAKKTGRDIAVIGVGERYSRRKSGEIIFLDEIQRLVFTAEDFLGAGAIIAQMDLEKTPEAKVCELAFRSSQGKLKELVQETASGKQIMTRGREKEIDHLIQLNYYDVVPIIHKGMIK